MEIKAKVKTLKEILDIEKVVGYSNDSIEFEKGDWGFGTNKYIGKTIKLKKIVDDEYDYEYFDDNTIWYFKKEWLTDIKEEVNWSKVQIDTKVEMSHDGKKWYRGHFAGVTESGALTVFVEGKTKWTSTQTDAIATRCAWSCVRLAEVNKWK